MANRIVWQATDGSLRITIPADPKADLDAVAAHAMQADPTLAECVRLPDVDAAALPSRRFRSCWRHGGGKVDVDLPLARQQRIAEIRKDRNVRLAASDTELIILQEDFDAGDARDREEMAKLKAKRQALRDLPAVVEADLAALTTADALALYSPTWPGETP